MTKFHLRRAGAGRRLSVPDALVTVLSSGDHTGGAYEVMLVDAPRGTPPPLHTEPWAKTYHLLRGRILVQLDGDGCELPPGDSLTVPAGTKNTFSVLTDRAVLLLVCAGSAMSGFFARVDAVLHEQHSPADIALLLPQVADRFDIRFAPGTVSP
ncbi:cupin domain-containing protein [Rhodococcus chondri]|uniref:Cupin domain-containing protein n=1 Tax=Rhodococcus chondri TaxID=3065941 RepID=A0ABU7JZX4_9NOCA|nr:cupin domain-containing protein [Rhodococcus sp. CC-R104]MEE2035558.1 cupin domain-containing protein [Rhodococcus sp. CC-R104]